MPEGVKTRPIALVHNSCIEEFIDHILEGPRFRQTPTSSVDNRMHILVEQLELTRCSWLLLFGQHMHPTIFLIYGKLGYIMRQMRVRQNKVVQVVEDVGVPFMVYSQDGMR